MTETPVLHFPVSGQEDGSFLLEVSSNGSRPLDLKLIGSESTAVYLVKLRHKRIDEYKATPGHCTNEEWEQILTSIFVDLNPIPDVEVRADVQSDGSAVTLSFRKNIQGITQRLGSIKLDGNDKTEISPFDWCVSAIAARSRMAEELAAAKGQVEALENSVAELRKQLDDFITSKAEDETQMLEKFRDLLNAKKLKIRQQQRLLAAASVDPAKLARIPNAGRGGDEEVGGTHHRDAGPSRRGKRKIKDEDDSDGNGDDDGFGRMDVDKQSNGPATDDGLSDPDIDEDQQVSTEHDDATASDTSDGDSENEGGSPKEPPTVAQVRKKKGKEVSPPRSKGKGKAKAKPQAPARKSGPSRNTRSATQQTQAPAADDSDDDEDKESEDEAPPPPRALPFMRGKKTQAQPPKPADDDETASGEDSEL
ncbi:hypothetical protein F5Y17DRAFT_425450 [Xylariaceae sp. FL0594]|nr:hypothetical protein F5Y17DRAFT_425450 [Xylariaceae sp. FL0594]